MLLMFSCENIPEEQRICSERAHLCANLHYDSFCPGERAALVINREKTELHQPTPEMSMYNELLASEVYRDCIKLKSQVRYNQHKKRETDRTEAYINILSDIKRLERATSASTDPYLSSYHWTRKRNRSSLNNLLVAESQGDH